MPRLTRGSARPPSWPAGAVFDLMVHFGEPGDPTVNPTAIWPERPTLVADRLELTAITGDVEPIVFDPTNLTDGVASDVADEVLQLRRITYGLSYAARSSHWRLVPTKRALEGELSETQLEYPESSGTTSGWEEVFAT